VQSRGTECIPTNRELKEDLPSDDGDLLEKLQCLSR